MQAIFAFAALILAQTDVGATAPAFSLPRIDGDGEFGPDQASDKKLVIVSFFATYCEPCKTELPELARLDRAYREHGLGVMIVSVDEGDDKVGELRALAQQHDVRFPVLHDRMQLVARRYAIEQLPRMLMLDANGVVVAQHVGYTEALFATLEADVRARLGMSDAATVTATPTGTAAVNDAAPAPPASASRTGAAPNAPVTAPVTAPTPTALQGTVLVLDIEAVGVPVDVAKSTTSALTQALAARPKLEIVSLSDLVSAADVAKAREALRCETDEQCLAALTDKTNAQLVVGGTLGKVGSALTLTLALYDGQSVNVRGRATAVFDKIEQLPQEIDRLVEELFGASSGKPRFKLPEGKPVSFAVLPFDATGVSPETARNLTEIFAVELKRIDGASVLGMDDVTRIIDLEKEKAMLLCSQDASCLAEIGGALGVDKIVAGQVGKLGAKYVIGARLIDRDKVVVDNRVSESYVGDEAQLIRAVRQVARTLVGVDTDAARGAILVTASESGARVYLNAEDVERARTPGPPIGELDPGRYSVRVVLDGFYDFQTDLYVDPGETTTQWIVLEEKPLLVRPFIPQWTLWTMAGTSAALLVGAGATFSAALWSLDDHNQYREGKRELVFEGSDDRARGERTQILEGTSYALLGGAVVVGLGTAIAIPFVHWDEETPSPSLPARRDGEAAK